jgi:beta-lactamase class D
LPWLGSSLKISPDEQVTFLRRLYRNDTPFDRSNVEIVKRVLVQEETEGVVFSGKTGSCDAGGGQRAGWFVGRQASPTREYVFATRIVAADRGAPAAKAPTGFTPARSAGRCCRLCRRAESREREQPQPS